MYTGWGGTGLINPRVKSKEGWKILFSLFLEFQSYQREIIYWDWCIKV